MVGRKNRGVYDDQREPDAYSRLSPEDRAAVDEEYAARQSASFEERKALRAEQIAREEQAAATGGTVEPEPNAMFATGKDYDRLKQGLSPGDLQQKEDTVGKGYTGSGPKPDDSKPERLRKKQVLANASRRFKKKGLLFGLLGGGGLIGGIGLFSITLGPLQFIHISNMLMDHDFSALDDANDDKAARLLRYAFYARQGAVQKTRLGYLGNKYADRFEVRLQSVGLKTAYTQVFGFKDGYVVDRREPEYRGMDDKQLINHFKENYGVDLKPGSAFGATPALNKSGIFVVDMRPGAVTYRQNKKFVKTQMQKAGLNRVTSAIATNVLRHRAGISLHPIKRMDARILRKLELAYQEWRKTRNESIRRGTYTAPRAQAGTNENSPEEQRENANRAAEAGQNTIDEASRTNADIAAGKPGALSKFSQAINTKWGMGGIVALTIPCTLRGIATDADTIKHEQVVLPAERMGMEAIAVGQQVAYGSEDNDSRVLGFYQNLAQKEDPNREDGYNASTWSDSQVIQTINGAEPNVGEPPPETLRKINEGTPFDFLNEGAVGATMDVVCSTAVQAGVLIISFIGGPVTAALGILTSPLTYALLQEAAKWMAGSPLDVDAQGAEWGSIVAYGSRLASNDQALASGGTVVTKETEQSLDAGSKYVLDQEFRAKSLAQRLFDPYDYRTPVGRLIDSQNIDSATHNVASLTTNFLNVGGNFGNLALNLVSGRSSADGSGYYDYGFPRVAVDPSVYMKADYANPYKTADDAALILEGPDGQKYIDRAKECNGVTIKKDDDGLWNVVSDQGSTPRMSAYKQPECSADGSVTADSFSQKTVASSQQASGWTSSFSRMTNSFASSFFGLFSRRTSAQQPAEPQVKAAAGDKNWETVTQFMNSTVNMNALACKFGDDPACYDAGFLESIAAGTNPAPVGPGGDPRSIAKLINDNPNITFQTAAGEAAFQEIVQTGAQKDCGGTIAISPTLLSIIQSLADPAKGANAYKIRLGVFSIGHGCDGGQHSRGTAVDINGVGRGNIMSPNNQLHFEDLNSAQMNVVRQFYTDFANSFPDKMGGMGQIQCFPGGPPPKRPGVIYFNDSCNHLHVDARKN